MTRMKDYTGLVAVARTSDSQSNNNLLRVSLDIHLGAVHVGVDRHETIHDVDD